MSDILQYKVFSNKIEEALNEKAIGDVHVEYNFDPSVFGAAIMVAIDDPTKNYTPYYKEYRWYYNIVLGEFIIKGLFDNEEETSRLISEIVSEILDKYKEHVYKRYFFD